MSLRATIVTPDQTLAALGASIAAAKGDDRLAPVVVAVPTNACGVMARRALGRAGGIAGVDMVTLNRLAELIAGPALAAADRRPVSTAIVDRAIASVLADDPRSFAPVAAHPSTVVALRRVHEELRLCGATGLAALEQSSARAREVARVSRAVTARLAAEWYDEADLYTLATERAAGDLPSDLRRLVVHLPQELPALARDFLAALAGRIDVDVVVQRTGDPDADADVDVLLDGLGVEQRSGNAVAGWPLASRPSPAALCSTTDADDEVRAALRVVVDSARTGVPLERIAILWPAQRPYARLVEHHLDAAGIRWNGRPGTALTERLAPRLALDLLDLDRRGLRRRDLFELLADIPRQNADGTRVPRQRWEQVSRHAGVARGDDWNRRLGPITGHERWGPAATSLREFVAQLRSELGHPASTRPWREWSAWCNDHVEGWLGRATLDHLDDAEFRAWEALGRALDRLSHLDSVAGPVTRHQFRLTLEAELDESPARVGRVGDGVTVAPLAGAAGLDVDVAVVLGAAEGVLPPRPTPDPLLSERDRLAGGLATSDARAVRLRRQYLAVLATTTTTVTRPRGDLRATAHLLPSRWIADDAHAERRIASHHAGLLAVPFPATAAEHRLRGRYAHVRAGGDVADVPGAHDDLPLQRGTSLLAARASDRLTEYDGDLSGVEVPRLADPISPSRLEAWVACPHAYFVRYLLGVRPVEEPDAEISITALDRGSAHHDVLDRFHREVISGVLPQPTHDGWTELHRTRLVELFDEVSASNERRGRTGRRAFWADERERMRAELVRWLEVDSLHARERGSIVVASELRFGLETDIAVPLASGRRLMVQGSIDRVDRTTGGSLVVTDHKTGKNAYKKLAATDPTLGGTVFQLPTYAAAARASFGEAATVVHGEYSMMRKGGFERAGYTFDPDVDARVSEQIEHIVAAIEAGWFPNLPERPGFRIYVDCEYCEPDHLGTAERWSEWQRKRHDPRLAPWFGEPADGSADGSTDGATSGDTAGVTGAGDE